jgi:hypothetical protein
MDKLTLQGETAGNFRVKKYDLDMKNGVFWDVTPCDSLRTEVSQELSASFVRVTRLDELGTTLAVTSNRRTLRRNTKSSQRASVARYS